MEEEPEYNQMYHIRQMLEKKEQQLAEKLPSTSGNLISKSARLILFRGIIRPSVSHE
jgi:hypothetical protein